MVIGDTPISITLTKNELHPDDVMTTHTLTSAENSTGAPTPIAPPIVSTPVERLPFVIESIHDDETDVETGMRLTLNPPFVSIPFNHTLSTTLEEDALAPLFGGVEWAGTRFWAAAQQTIEVLQERKMLLVPKTKRVLELGAGLGVPGICVSEMYDSVESVIVTDSENLLPQLTKNTESLEKVHPAALWWGEDDVSLLSKDGKGWDLVLCCDCIYEPLYGDSWAKLVDVLVQIFSLNDETVALVSCERRKGDRVEDWVILCESKGLVVSMEDRGSEGCEEMQWCEGQRTGKVEVFTVVIK
ncbi:hypothetical protein TrCOL_g4865 [Triparma columacea]|uniref:Uncharacterized protein n=1 Tax=Triparma columacea TaxID=722753 RepID=A0A9W7GQ12_9STRA|nr:hypothetical protein TrCOL_g4865 [Triparma columacea]